MSDKRKYEHLSLDKLYELYVSILNILNDIEDEIEEREFPNDNENDDN
ncbi:MAG: hypothetical protein GY804_11455 [Alphaproteobacteria bacterium]|nr:hypothetical protein [Alphaproteobacteria bacterium]